jgi:hypothetical protein
MRRFSKTSARHKPELKHWHRPTINQAGANQHIKRLIERRHVLPGVTFLGTGNHDQTRAVPPTTDIRINNA